MALTLEQTIVVEAEDVIDLIKQQYPQLPGEWVWSIEVMPARPMLDNGWQAGQFRLIGTTQKDLGGSDEASRR